MRLKLAVRLQQEEKGQGLTEFVLVLVLVSLAAIAAMGTLAEGINIAFNSTARIVSCSYTPCGPPCPYPPCGNGNGKGPCPNPPCGNGNGNGP